MPLHLHSLNLKSRFYVAMQLGCVAFIFIVSPIPKTGPALYFFALPGVMLGVSAIVAIGIGNFNIVSDVKRGGRFRDKGPYRYIRHPMYLALLIVTGSMVCHKPSFTGAAVWFVLLAVLIAKIRYEERLLAKAFPQYKAYRKATWRLIPFIH